MNGGVRESPGTEQEFLMIRKPAYFPVITSRYADDNKRLMTGPEGNSSFCFPRISMFPRGAAEGNIEIRGKQNELFPEGPVIK